jgi:hypothetical protein
MSRFVAFVLVFIAGTMLPFMTGDLPAAAVRAQSSTWEVIGEPEAVAGVKLAIVRHVTTQGCYLLAHAEGVSIQPVSRVLCGGQDEWESIVGEGERLRMHDGIIVGSELPSQPSAGSSQTTKQPGVPR